MLINLLNWIPNKTLVLALGLSAGITLASLVFAPVIIARLPVDYFEEQPQRPRKKPQNRHPIHHFAIISFKNLLGVSLVIAGAAMVPFPGQGILTIIVGASLVDFPGKRRLLRSIARQPRVLRSLNWIREKAHKAPFVVQQPVTAAP